jgi:hypothetical protein
MRIENLFQQPLCFRSGIRAQQPDQPLLQRWLPLNRSNSPIFWLLHTNNCLVDLPCSLMTVAD